MARSLNVLLAFATLAFLAAGGVAQAQTCDTLLGKADCGGSAGDGTSPGRRSNTPAGPTGFSTQALGRGLSVTDDDQTGMFGAITFGGRGTTCSGPFRVRNC